MVVNKAKLTASLAEPFLTFVLWPTTNNQCLHFLFFCQVLFLQTLLREGQKSVSKSVIISPWKKAWHPFEQTLILYSPKCFVLNLNKIDPVFLEGG